MVYCALWLYGKHISSENHLMVSCENPKNVNQRYIHINFLSEVAEFYLNLSEILGSLKRD